MEKASWHAKITMCLLIVGNLIGAGILAMPVEIGIAGMLPAFIGLFVLGGMMLLTALILSNEALESKDDLFNYPTLYAKYLGAFGKWLATAVNILILYGMMVAYLSGGAVVIAENFGGSGCETISLIAFFIFLAAVTFGGKRFVHHANAFMVLLMWIAFAIIVIVAGRHIKVDRLNHADWSFFPFALPVILTAFWFHNLVPNVCRNLKWERKAICQVITFAVFVGFVMYLVWTFVAVGAIPLDDGKNSLIEAYALNLPATIPLQNISKSLAFKFFASAFALIALATSYISMALGAMGFNEDLFRKFIKNVPRGFLILLTIAPSFLIALFFTDLFIKAVNLVGGLGMAVLYGILPCSIALIHSRRVKGSLTKIIFVLALFVFIALALWQILVEFGILQPAIRHVSGS